MCRIDQSSTFKRASLLQHKKCMLYGVPFHLTLETKNFFYTYIINFLKKTKLTSSLKKIYYKEKEFKNNSMHALS